MNDSRLGLDDGETDLEQLVEDCNNQVERPDMSPRQQSSGRLNREGSAGENAPTGGRGISINQMQLMLEQNHKLIELMSKQQQQNSEEGNKRKFRDEVNFAVQGPTLLLETNYRLEDDAHSKLDLSLRQKLRPINADPTAYWVKGAFNRVDRPILGSSLYLEHLMPGFVNEATICKVYDVCAYTEIKNYLTKNAGVDRESQKKLKVKTVTEDHLSMGIQTHWAQANDVWEVMDAGKIPINRQFMAFDYELRIQLCGSIIHGEELQLLWASHAEMST